MIEIDVTNQIKALKDGEKIEIRWEEGETIVFKTNTCEGTFIIEDKKDD
jgi:hypothetical protein